MPHRCNQAPGRAITAGICSSNCVTIAQAVPCRDEPVTWRVPMGRAAARRETRVGIRSYRMASPGSNGATTQCEGDVHLHRAPRPYHKTSLAGSILMPRAANCTPAAAFGKAEDSAGRRGGPVGSPPFLLDRGAPPEADELPTNATSPSAAPRCRLRTQPQLCALAACDPFGSWERHLGHPSGSTRS